MKGLDDEQTAEAERKMGRMEAIIHSMTPAERANPDILSPSRKHRIAKGAGVGHQRSEPYDQAVQRDEKTDETIWQAGKEEEIRISVLNMIYREFRVI